MKMKDLIRSMVVLSVFVFGMSLIIGSGGQEEETPVIDDPGYHTYSDYYIDIVEFEITMLGGKHYSLSWSVDFQCATANYFMKVYFSKDDKVDDGDRLYIDYECPLNNCVPDRYFLMQFPELEPGDYYFIARGMIFDGTLQKAYSEDVIYKVTII